MDDCSDYHEDSSEPSDDESYSESEEEIVGGNQDVQGENSENEIEEPEQIASTWDSFILWSNNTENFVPKRQISDKRNCILALNIENSTTPY